MLSLRNHVTQGRENCCLCLKPGAHLWCFPSPSTQVGCCGRIITCLSPGSGERVVTSVIMHHCCATLHTASCGPDFLSWGSKLMLAFFLMRTQGPSWATFFSLCSQQSPSGLGKPWYSYCLCTLWFWVSLSPKSLKTTDLTHYCHYPERGIATWP